MTLLKQLASIYSKLLYIEEYGQIAEDSYIEGFETAKKLIAEKMDNDCYDQECGFSSKDILKFGNNEIE